MGHLSSPHPHRGPTLPQFRSPGSWRRRTRTPAPCGLAVRTGRRSRWALLCLGRGGVPERPQGEPTRLSPDSATRDRPKFEGVFEEIHAKQLPHVGDTHAALWGLS
nr:uncharacterized protein LOC105868592 isoform X2 [Microcebus murinus]